MKRVKAVFRWIVMNGLIATCLWLGLIEGVAGALNIALFFLWVVVVASFATLNDDLRKKLAAKPEFPAVPLWLDGFYDLGILCLLVWSGRWITGAGYAVSIVMHHGLFAAIEKIRTESAQAKEKPNPKINPLDSGAPRAGSQSG